MMVAFAKLAPTIMVAAYLEQTLFNSTGHFEALYKAVNSLPITMLTGIMSTQLIKWVIGISQYFIYGGIGVLQLLRSSLIRENQLKAKNGTQGKAKAHSEWMY